MRRPDALGSDAPLLWSPGTGNLVWAMFRACLDGDLADVKRLAADHPELLRCHWHDRTPLYFAVRENRLEVVEYLLERTSDPLALEVHDRFLEIAQDRGYAEMERRLTERLSVLRNISPRGEPVAAAIRAYDAAEVRRLLDAEPELLHVGDSRSNQPLHWAVMTRQIDLIDELLARGADLDAQRADGARPIHLSNGDYFHRGWRDVPKDWATTPAEVLDHLIARGAFYDIWTATHRGDLERVRALLDTDPSLANRNSDYNSYYHGCGSALRNAASNGHLEVVKLLLERGADPNLPEEGIAPRGHALYAAAANRHYAIAKLLLEHGAEPNAPVESSADALSRAISNDDQPMIDLLCQYGAARELHLLAYYGDVRTAAAMFAANPALADDPEALANAGEHAPFVRLMLRYQPDLPKRVAFKPQTRELAELLFEHGMDSSLPDWLGITPLHQFARAGDLEGAEWFLDHGADLTACDDDSCSTPLGWAAKYGQRQMVELLLSRGAPVNLPDDPPWATPLAWAERRGHTEIAQLLRAHGAL